MLTIWRVRASSYKKVCNLIIVPPITLVKPCGNHAILRLQQLSIDYRGIRLPIYILLLRVSIVKKKKNCIALGKFDLKSYFTQFGHFLLENTTIGTSRIMYLFKSHLFGCHVGNYICVRFPNTLSQSTCHMVTLRARNVSRYVLCIHEFAIIFRSTCYNSV